jgi:hypothetical protein
MRWIGISCLALVAGCTTTREVTISARPPDAMISIDGTEMGRGPVKMELTFNGSDDVHRVTATRLGYTPRTVDLTRSDDNPDVMIALSPRTRKVSFHITPVPANLTIDGKPVSEEPVQDYSTALPFTVDEQNQWTQYIVRASHEGYQPVEQAVRWGDASDTYRLSLDAMRKDLSITTTPPGAQVSLEGRPLGVSPVTAHAVPFPVDATSGQYLPQKVTVSKPGYDPVTTTISWDGGRDSYHVDLVPKTKTVHILTVPANAVVTVDGQEVHTSESGVGTIALAFPPVDEKGTLRTYKAVVSKKTADTEWIPRELTIPWDQGKTNYSVTLEEVKTRPVALLRARTIRTDAGWQVEPESIQTLAMKDLTEGPTAEPPARITDLSRGSVIDTVNVAPDGQWLVFSVLMETGKSGLRSQVQMVRADGSGQPVMFGDGKTLDLDPSFTPDGSQIVFSSNRGGRHMSIWQVAASGEGGVTQLTSGDTTDLWPSVDSDPKPRLYYEALVDSRPDPRVYMAQLGTTLRTDLTQSGGEQPRVSPKADSVLFTLVNDKSGKRDIYKMSDRGGGAINLTNTTDFDNFDPAWSKDGNKVAFVSDRGVDADGRHNNDIYVLDLMHPDKPTRITANGSWDDSPSWDPSGKYIYFRSNRGGNWAIWRVTLSKASAATRPVR